MNKKIFLIVAMSENRVIGKDNKLPWHFSCDLKKFKAVTSGNTVIMGRKTYESIGKPLPGRENIVLSASRTDLGDGVQVVRSLADAMSKASGEKVFIIGGESVYRKALEECDIAGIYLTMIHQSYEGDAFFPELPGNFKKKTQEILQSENPRIDFLYMENTAGKAHV